MKNDDGGTRLAAAQETALPSQSDQRQATPRPWDQNGEDEPAGCRISIEKDGAILAEVLNFDDFPCLDQRDDVEAECVRVDAEARANAALIVKAVNCHEALYEALKALVARAEREMVDPIDVDEIQGAKAALAKVDAK